MISGPLFAVSVGRRVAVKSGAPFRRAVRRLLMACAAVAMVSFGMWLRWPRLREGIHRDEAASLHIASATSIRDFRERSRVSDYNPPLFNLLLAGWIRLAGTGELALKLYALLLGLILLLVGSWTATRLFGPLAGLLTLFLAALSPLLYVQSTELRPYSLLGIVGGLYVGAATALADRAGRRDRIGKVGFLTVGCSILLVYCHHQGTVFVAAVGLAALGALLLGSRRAVWRWLFLGAALAALALVPWLPVLLHQLQVGTPWVEPMTGSEKLQNAIQKYYRTWPAAGFSRTALLPVLSLPAAVVLFLRRGAVLEELRKRSFPFTFLLLGIVPALLIFGLGAPQERYVFLPGVLMMILFAGFLSVLWDASKAAAPTPRFRSAPAAVAVATVGILWHYAALGMPGILQARQFLGLGMARTGMRALCEKNRFGPDTLVIVAPDYIGPEFLYYCPRARWVRGFVKWNDVGLMDPTDYALLWNDARAVGKAVRRIERFVSENSIEKLAVIRDRRAVDRPLRFESQSMQLVVELECRVPLIRLEHYHGRDVRYDLYLFDVRSALEEADAVTAEARASAPGAGSAGQGARGAAGTRAARRLPR